MLGHTDIYRWALGKRFEEVGTIACFGRMKENKKAKEGTEQAQIVLEKHWAGRLSTPFQLSQ